MKNLGQVKKSQLEPWELKSLKDYKYYGYRTIGHYSNTYSTTKELFFCNKKFKKNNDMTNNKKTEKLTFYSNN